MWASLERLLDSSMFSPHGICLLWEPELIWLHVASDAIIAVAYFSIPFALSIFVSRRRDIEFGWWLAKKMGELDVGQSVAVKERAVLAVDAANEEFEVRQALEVMADQRLLHRVVLNV